MTVVILDVDGILVDTNYQHAIAWCRAFREQRVVLPIWRIHRHIVMGGDQLVGELAGEEVQRRLGERLRSRESELYGELTGEVELMKEATELLRDLHQPGHTVILASSAKESEIEHYVDLLDVRDVADGWNSSSDVQATKPKPDLVHAALECAGADPERAIMVGDSPLGRGGGATCRREDDRGHDRRLFPEELREAGAVEVFESASELKGALGHSVGPSESRGTAARAMAPLSGTS